VRGLSKALISAISNQRSGINDLAFNFLTFKF
jgi:hypothetical protein